MRAASSAARFNIPPKATGNQLIQEKSIAARILLAFRHIC
jgi:hypothetical protein